MVRCPDILAFDLASLGGKFLGIIINAPLAGSAASGGSTDGTASAGTSLSVSELVKLKIEAAAASDAMLCCWASKAGVAPALRCINAWGAKYVENLTWVHLTAGGGIAALTPPHNAPVRASHSTLVMGRRGSGARQLRHQRSPDVLLSPALSGGRFPDEVRKMMETLLPVGEDEGPRFLEIAFQGGEERGRAGWVTLVQDTPCLGRT